MAFELTDQIRRHLDSDAIMILTTITPSGRPAPKPVWFLWDGSALTVFSQPQAAKIRHIAGNPQVCLSTGVGAGGGDFVCISGTAEVLADGPSAVEIPAYRERYGEAAAHMGTTIEQLAADYNTNIRITPTHVWAIP